MKRTPIKTTAAKLCAIGEARELKAAAKSLPNRISGELHRSPASTQLLRRAAEIDPEAASLLSEHPRNVDGAILLVRLLG